MLLDGSRSAREVEMTWKCVNTKQLTVVLSMLLMSGYAVITTLIAYLKYTVG